MIRAWVVDDEALAVKRLSRMLTETGGVEVVGSSSDAEDALEALNGGVAVDALFLDIEMPGMNGFELLSRLERQPLTIFTTAYDQYAVKAFEANGTDYLLKPVTPAALERAIARIEKAKPADVPDYKAMLAQLASAIGSAKAYPKRLPSKLGDRVQFLDLEKVTHFYAEQKLTYAVVAGMTPFIEASARKKCERPLASLPCDVSASRASSASKSPPSKSAKWRTSTSCLLNGGRAVFARAVATAMR